MVKKLYNLPEEPTYEFRPMAKKDIASTTKLINDGLTYFWLDVENMLWNFCTQMNRWSIILCQETM